MVLGTWAPLWTPRTTFLGSFRTVERGIHGLFSLLHNGYVNTVGQDFSITIDSYLNSL